MARLAVTKCQGTGNDFVLLDRTDRMTGAHLAFSELARALCDRRFGVGADGLLVLANATKPGADVALRIFNADGSEAEMCGNGIRCVARYWHERRSGALRPLSIQTPAGNIRAEIVPEAPRFAVRVAMGVPEDIFVYDDPLRVGDVTADIADVLIGNPHSVAFVDVDPAGIDLAAVAADVASGGQFPDGVNVELAHVRDGSITMRVFERGVGETWACGTGACAAAAAAIMTGRAQSPVRVAMRGGDVQVEWAGGGNQAYLTGGAEIIFDADVEVANMLAAVSAASAM